MLKDFGRIFCVIEKGVPSDDTGYSLGSVLGFLKDTDSYEHLCRYWIFRNDKTGKYYAFWDLGNGWYRSEYYEADTLEQLIEELKQVKENVA